MREDRKCSQSRRPFLTWQWWYNATGASEEDFVHKTLGIAMAAIGTALAIMLAGAAAPSAPTTAPASQPAKDLTLDLGDKVSLKLVLIPAGKFLMGSPESEKGRDRIDETQHEVTIGSPFYMGVTHVTVDQFAVFAKNSEYRTDAEKEGKAEAVEIKDGKLTAALAAGCSWRNTGFEQKSDHPVVQVSWNDATAFCGWLSKKSGKTVTLPTEAQWEYACRAGSTTAYPWGDNPDDGKGWANCADQSLKQMLPNQPDLAAFKWDDGFVFTSPVGSFKPNAFGLYDMTGNAMQLCQDHPGNFGKGLAWDPTGAATPDLRALRGSSWNSSPELCRSANRAGGVREDRHSFSVGFRVAVTVGVN